jgi:hypothetical protein
MKKIMLLLIVIVTFSSCEKDDICNEDTTPRLIMEFYDISNPTIKKNVVNLKVTGENASAPLGTYSGVSKIELPLNPTANTTKYSLILNSTSTTVDPNEDFLEFNYTHENIYVSRACGYKTIYTLNNSGGVIQSDPSTPDTFWIQNYSIATTSITNENETHIKIYF